MVRTADGPQARQVDATGGSCRFCTPNCARKNGHDERELSDLACTVRVEEVPFQSAPATVASVEAVQDVLKAARSRAQALIENDAARLSELMHRDLRWTTFRGEVLDRDQYVRGNTDGSLRWLAQTLEHPDVVVVGNTAVLVGVVVDSVERDGTRQTFRLRLTQTWIRQDSGWQCLSGHAGPAVDAV